jgi:hypothetical protein
LIGFQFGGIIACKLVNFSFSFIFYSIHRINYVFEQNFKFVGVCVFLIYLLIRSKFKFVCFSPVCDWLQN